MVLADHRSIADPLLDPMAQRLHDHGVEPDHLTWASLAVAAVAGLAFFAATPSRPLPLVAGGLLVALNALMDGLDGKMARATDSAGPRGDYLDHAIDRFADVLIVGGLTFSPFVTLEVGLLALVGMLLTSYLGTQAQAVGLGRDLGGLVGRADRLVLLAVFPWAQAAVLGLGLVAPWSLLVVVGPLAVRSLLDLLVLFLAVMGLLTAAQRFVRGLKGF